MGNGPASVKVGTGLPASVTAKVNAVPTRAVAELGLENEGASLTVRVKFCVALAVPLMAVRLTG